MTIREFKEKVYEEFKEEIDLISENSKTENWQADISVSTDMFLSKVDDGEYDEEIEIRVAQLRSEID